MFDINTVRNHRPKFCPNCGKPLDGLGAVEDLEDDDGSVSFDTYCTHCGWSGDISPDRLTN